MQNKKVVKRTFIFMFTKDCKDENKRKTDMKRKCVSKNYSLAKGGILRCKRRHIARLKVTFYKEKGNILHGNR